MHLSSTEMMQELPGDRVCGPSSPAAEASTSSPTAGASASITASPAGERTTSVHMYAEAANVSPEKSRCIPSCVATTATHPSFQHHGLVADEAPTIDGPQYDAVVASDSKACQPRQACVASNQQEQAAASTSQHVAATDKQLQAVHAQYVAALRSGKQQQQQQGWPQQQTAPAVPDAQPHLQALRQQLPSPDDQQLPQQLRHKQRQQLPKHLHDRAAASEERLPRLHQQQQQLLDQQQALAAYQAALGRPTVHEPAGPSGHGITVQHQLPEQLHAQLPVKLPHPVVQQRQAQGAGPGHVSEQGPRKVPGSVALPCNATQAQNVYKAFQWQKDALDFADACNRQAAGLGAGASEQGQSLTAYVPFQHKLNVELRSIKTSVHQQLHQPKSAASNAS